MAPILSKSKTLKRQGVTIVLLLLLAGGYYALVVPGKTAYFEDRYFRQLAEYNDNLRETIGTLCSSLINAATKGGAPSKIRDTLELSPYFSAIEVITNASVATHGLSLRVLANAPILELEFTRALTSTNGLRVRTHSQLAQLMQAFVSRSEFHDVLLLGSSNEVHYQLSPGSLRLNQLKIPMTESFTTNLVNLAGGDFRLFAQPVRITGPPDSGSATLDWVLCGLVREEQFRRQTWAMDYTMLAVFCFAALMLVVSWPLLNLWGGGLRGGLGLVEIFLLAFSALFVTALLTLTALDRYAYGGARVHLDERLQSFSASLVNNLNAELKAVAGQLEALDRIATKHPDWTDLTEILAQPYFMDPDAPLYPWLRMVFWAGPDGQQTNKWTVKDQNTAMIKVSSRAYFRTIAEGRGWTNANGWTTNTYCLEPIYSRNTGENLAIYMTPSLTDPNRLVAIDLRLLTLVRPVVPVGYGFAVVDAEGAVLFHADEQRNLRENFFTECGQPADLRGRIYGRTAGLLTVSYFQKPHRLYVTPLKGLPWSLVVFHDVTRLQLAEISIVSVAGLMFLIYASGLLLAAIFFRLTDGARAFHWLWPRRSATESYWLLACLLLALVAAAVFVVVWNPEPFVTFIVALAAPAVGVILTHAALTFGWRRPERYSFRPLRHRLNFWCMQISRYTRIPESVRVWRLDHRHGYVAAMGLLLVLAGVVPPLAFFRIAFDQEVTLMVKHSQLRMAGDLEAREDRVRAEIKGGAGLEGSTHASLRVADPQKYISLRLTNQWDVHEFNCQILAADNKSRPARTTESEIHGSFARFLRAMRPYFSELDVEPGGLWQNAASDDSWRWQREDGALIFWKDSRSGPLRLRATLPHLTVPGPFWVLGFLIVLAMPFCIFFFVADQVLLLREPAPVRTQPPWKAGKYLLLGPPHSKKSELLTADNFKALAWKPGQLNLRLPEDRRLAPTRLDEWFTDTGQPIVVDHFEYQLEDARFNREKFRFLQEFAFDESRSLIIVSNVHPLLFPLANDAEAEPPGSTALARLKLQRAETLAAYKKIYKDGESDLALASLPRDATVHLIRAHFRSLWVTCSPKEQEILHQVARGRLVGGRQPELGPLLERKLLTLNPGLQLLPDERFRRFILTHYQPDPDAELDEAASLWQAMKAPAATALIVVAAFFYLTQPALWKHTIGLTPAFIGGIGALMQVLGLFKRSKPEARPPQV